MSENCSSSDPEACSKEAQQVKCEQTSIEDSESTEEPKYPSMSKIIIIVLAIYLAAFLVALDQTIIGVAIPKITDQFKSISDIAWYGSAYFLTSTALQPSYGRIYRIFSVCQEQILLILKSRGQSNAASGEMVFFGCGWHL